MNKQVRIVSDGTPHGTHIYNHDGTEIKNVRTGWISLDAIDVVSASLEIFLPSFEVDLKSSDIEIIFVCPLCAEKISHNCHGPESIGTQPQRMSGEMG